MTRFFSIALFAAAVLPFAFATNDCQQGEFFFQQKSCCLPHGGPVNPPAPPKGVACPTSGWSWHKGKQCCVPHQPPKPNNPPPQCPKECSEWSAGDLKCYPGKPTPPSPPPSKPSGSYNQPGYPGGNNNHWRRSKLHSRSAPLCPSGLEACPIEGALGGEFECLDTNEELESCGGCASTGEGQDCTAIEGAWNVACNQGSCAVYTCQQGYKVARDGKSCVAL